MILATHMVVGAAGAEIAGLSGIAAFVLGWGSHYVLDSITHWDYPLSATTAHSATGDGDQKRGGMQGLGKLTMFDVMKIGIDVCAGFLLVFFFLRDPAGASLVSLFLGALGGVFPDIVQFVYSKIKWRPVVALQKVHHMIHAETDLKDRPWLGFSLQVALVAVVILFVSL